MNNKFGLFALYLGGAAAICSGAAITHAGQIYVYKDNNGSTLLTNRKSSDRSLTKIKATYYPDSNIHSYSNWGSSESSVLPSYSRNKNTFDHIIKQASQQHGVSEGLIKAVMHTESGFNVNARSPVGAQGLMQLMPATARRFNVSNAYDPYQNIMAGARYLAWLTKRFNGNTAMVLAGYNAGEGNVQKYGGVPPFRETQDYVRRVTSRFNNLYSNGTGIVSDIPASSSASGKIIASSDNYEQPAPSTELKATKYQRQVIQTADGSYTDAPGSYATANASASARIYFKE
ncbi:lytic transglycosylase domain-containing protein [Acinetobacter pragensis]|uniref:Transglycosylase n=1 Tax=Acinetobacter pragensis TaxID=1806892 RepID=A0A151XX77_9GAMM|nr:lytic transglycosylase domain-containing protein [Acinetobacter pragensis]KYQ70431.1 transglycosylase [Acinetobacter pragensis]